MRLITLLITLSLLSLGAMSYAQKHKIGYINTNILWSLMPEKVEADSILEIERQKLGKYYSDLKTEYNAKVQALMSDTNTSKQSLIYQNKVRDLQNLESRLSAYEKEANQELERMRSEMYKPIKLQMEEAINAVAEEKGFDYILDQAFGNIVFVKDEKNNILPLVKQKLGLN